MKKVDVTRWERYFFYRNDGYTTERAARKARISESVAYRFESGDPSSSGIEAAVLLGVTQVGGNLVSVPYTAETKKALDDFAYFRLRYMGRKSTPWQERAAYEVLRLHNTDQREYVVLNEPPGSGKSTLFTHDIPAWMIARDRSVRIMLGSETGRQARMYLGRLKRTLEREHPLRADVDAVIAGTAFDAETTLTNDFGPFKPEARGDVWAASQITVRQQSGVSVDDKEPTASAWGRDEKFLGGRYDVVIWDDLISRQPSTEMWDQILEWWMTEAETRLEPGGLLILQGQRMWADDLYRYCLNMTRDDETPKYQHIVYKAHDDTRCTNQHENLKPWPDSCLLDPHRLPHHYLETVRRQSARVYEVQYQQTDGAGTDTLINPLWLTGGTDTKGNIYPGCYDNDRSLGDIHPDDLDGWSAVSIDPSPTNYWAIQWWIVKPENHRYILVDKHRRKMGAPDFLTLNLDNGKWSGILHDLYTTSVQKDAPITHVIVEVNAAQRYLLTQPHIQKWASATGVTFIPHQTHSNKNDPKFGVTSIADHYRKGTVRLPNADPTTRLDISTLTHELTRWPEARTDDEVMANWFMFKAIDTNYTPRGYQAPAFQRPDFINRYAKRGLPEQRPQETPMSRMSRHL
jgi:hypothetical protein